VTVPSNTRFGNESTVKVAVLPLLDAADVTLAHPEGAVPRSRVCFLPAAMANKANLLHRQDAPHCPQIEVDQCAPPGAEIEEAACFRGKADE
jgi:hypothetical protein